ncbi:hypothetical protein BV20DRAFT_955398 [Pilatotrama ljubarskyi]|nr:hypothetical protein BV20DRAFT_955398 [Pilatotrama ljubarskyi]
MERTFFRSFCMANNLKVLINEGVLPQLFKDYAPLLDVAFSGDNRDISTTAFECDPASEPRGLVLDEEKADRIPTRVYLHLLSCIQTDPTLNRSTTYRAVSGVADGSSRFLSPRGQTLPFIVHRGRRYSSASHGVGDSHVVVRSANSGTFLGQIQLIFIHKRRPSTGSEFIHQVFASIRPFRRSTQDTDASPDPYALYVGLGASLVYADAEDRTLVVPMRDVISHFVACPHRAEVAPVQRSRQVFVAIELEVRFSEVNFADVC